MKKKEEDSELGLMGARYLVLGAWIGVIGLYASALLADAGHNIQLKSALQGLGFAIGLLLLSELFHNHLRRRSEKSGKPPRVDGTTNP